MTQLNDSESFKLFSLNSNRPLANKISDDLGVELSDVEIQTFSDGEISISINESVRGDHVYVIQSTNFPINNSYMEIFIMVDALKRASAESVTVIMPYYGYARQDVKDQARKPITAKIIANLLEESGIDHMITMDMHSPQLQGFFNIPLEHMTAIPVLANYYKHRYLDHENGVVVVPNHSGANRGREYAELLDLPLAIMDRRSSDTDFDETITVIGDVKGKQCILVDDLSDTGGTLSKVAQALLENGAKEIDVMITHPVLSGEAKDSIDASPINRLIVTDTIDLSDDHISDKTEIVSVSHILAEAIKRVHIRDSMRPLYNIENVEKLEKE